MKKTILVLLLILLIAGCTLFQPQETPSTEYEIFSNIPTENAASLHFFKLTEHGASELSSLLGVALGGNILKKLSGGQIGVISYRDGSSTFVTYLKTNLTIDNLLEELPEYYEISKKTKNIGGREITVLSPSFDEENPICVWKEGDVLKLVFTQKLTLPTPSQCTFPAGLTCASYSLNENGLLTLELGQGTGRTIIVKGVACTQNLSPEYTTEASIYYQPARNVTIPSGGKAFIAQPGVINIACTDAAGKPLGTSIGSSYSGRIIINYTEADTGLVRIAVGAFSYRFKSTDSKNCEKILETKYDYKNVKSLLAESNAIKKEVPVNGKLVGEYQAYGESAFGTAFSDDNGVYVVYISKNQSNIPLLTLTIKSNVCYSPTGKASILKEGGKEACMDEVTAIGGSNLILQRGVGEYSILLYTIVKGSKSFALENAKKTIFSISLQGEEKRWSENASIRVVVYESGSMTKIPEAKVELYFDNELQSTRYTDSNGVAKFDDIHIPSLKKYKFVVSKQGYINASTIRPDFGISYYSWELDVHLQRDVTAGYRDYSPSTNVTIEEAKLSNVPIINAYGQPLVKIVVGEKGTARDVKAAGNIAAVIGNRAYRKINITASIDTTTSPPRCIPIIQQAALPYPIDTSKTKLVLLDDEVAPQMTNQNLLLVGNSGNKVISDLLKATSIDLQSDKVVMKAIGSNRILVAGYRAVDIITGADQFIGILVAATNNSLTPTPLTFSNVLVLNQEGKPTFTIVIGEGTTAEESVGAANIATLLGNLAFRKQSITANIAGSGASIRCEVSPTYSASRVFLNPAANKLVVLDRDVDKASILILIGPPEVNSVSREVYSAVSSLPKLTKGKAVVTAAGTNRIIIAGGTEMDTERAADKFIEWLAKKYN